MTGNKKIKTAAFALFVAIFINFALTEEAFSLNFRHVKNFIHTKRFKTQKKVKKHPSINARQNNYVDISSLRLDDEAMNKIDEIYGAEAKDVRPLALDLESKYIRQDELNAVHCRFYQRTCKRDLKQKQAVLGAEISELERQIWLKKESYKAQYLNATTRAQDIKLRKMIYNKTGGNMKLW